MIIRMDGKVITETIIKPDHKAVYQVVACHICGREHRHKLPSKGRPHNVYYWVWNCAKCGMERKRKLRAAKWPDGVRQPIYCSYACAWGAGNSRDHVADMVAMRQAGATLQTIGDKYGITRERVRQLLLPFNIPRDYKTPEAKRQQVKANYYAKKSRS